MRRHHRDHSAVPARPLRLVAVFALLAVTAAVFPALASADRAFSVRYTTNDTGNITLAANALMTCPTAAAGCAAAQSAASSNTTSNSALNNNNWDMTYIDSDADASTFNSSSSTLALPAGSTVLFAGLYWGGDWSTGSAAAPNAAARNTVKFRAPGAGAYSTVTASVLDDSTLNVGRYQGFANVTSQVQAAGVGSYTVANVQAGKGDDHYAGWSLVVVYRDTTQPARNLTVFDGLATIRASDPPTTIPVSGFTTPPAGAVKTTLGFITYEGDLGIVGDSASLNSTVLSNAQSPATNFFNSSISNNGVSVTTKTPNYNNQLGYDADLINADGILANGATSANIKVTTSGDQYLPGVITFATELYAPKIVQTKTVTDLNGGDVEAGDILEYRIAGTNSGQDDAVGFTLRDPIPNGTTYVAGSMNIVNGAGGPAGTLTDPAGDDRGELDTSVVGNRVVMRAGTGANATTGGRIAVGANYDLRFRVKVNSGLATGFSIDNTATASFFSASLNTPLTAVSTASTTVKSPDLTITKTHSGAIVPGGSVTYDLTVSNVGAAASQGTVTVSDTLPSSLTPPTSATGSGWTCSIVMPQVTCTRSDALPPGGAYPVIHLSAKVDPSASGTISNTATVSGGGDGNPANNTATDPSPSSPQADLSVKKTVPAGPYVVGDTLTYTLLVKNSGLSVSTATGVSSFDALPAGFTLISAVPSQGTCTPAVTCDLGTLAPGASATVTVKVLATSQSAGTRLDNTAVVTSAVPDPDPSNNTDTATADVGGIDLAVTKTANPASASPGGSIDYTVGVTNNGPSGATDVVLHDALPPELETSPAPVATVTSGSATCVVSSTAVDCNAPTLAAGASITVHIVGQLKATATGTITNIASASAAEHDTDSSNDTATAVVDVAASADLAVTKTAADPVIPGNNLVYTIVTKNNGPSSAANATMTDVLPAATTYVSNDDPAHCSVAGQTLTCSYGTLADGATRTVHVTVAVNPSQTTTFTNTATVTTTTPDGNPANDSSAFDSQVTPTADVSITKTSDHTAYQGGDLVTWTLVAHNDGPSTARNVTIDDDIPATLDVVSVTPGAPTCTTVARHVHCDFGSLAPGADRTVTIVTRAQGAMPVVTDTSTRNITVSKVEEYWSLQPGETSTIDVSCPNGGTASDGTLQIVDVDNGHGTPADVQVQQASSIALGTYRFVVKNTSTGQAQVRPQVTCLPATTDPDTAVYPIVVGPLQTLNSGSLAPGRHTFTIPVDAQHRAVAPGIEVLSGLARLVGSEPVAGGWRFTVDVQQTANVDVSLRLLDINTGPGGSPPHVYPLSFLHVVRTVTIGPGRTNQLRVSCPVGYKGIVGTYDLPPGVVALGSVPEPINRDFDLYNTNSHPVDVTLDLECIAIETGPPLTDHRTVTNTATVATTTFDDDLSNNSGSATITVDSAGGVPFPVAPPVKPPVAPLKPATPSTRTALSFGTVTVAPTGSKAYVPVRCAGATVCAGTVTLKVRVGATGRGASASAVRRVVVGRGSYRIAPGHSVRVTVRISSRYRRLMRSGRVRSVAISGGSTSTVSTVAVKR